MIKTDNDNFNFFDIIYDSCSDLNNYNIIEDNTWTFFDISHDTMAQGWKGHISSQIANSIRTARLSVTTLIENKCSFKIVKDKAQLKVINNFHYPLSGANKFITFYPNNEYHLAKILGQLEKNIGHIPAPRIFTDYQLRENSPLHFRYGAFKDISQYVAKDNRVVHYIRDSENNLVEDVRKPGKYKPKWIDIPIVLSNYLNVKEQKYKSYFKTYYSIIGSLSKANKGNVILAKRKSNNDPVIIKEARSNVSFEEYPYTCIDLLKNEHNVLRKLKHNKFTPQVLDFFEEQNNYYLVTEFFEGKNLSKLFLVEKEFPINTKKKIANEIVEIVNYLHDCEITIGDISTNNFMLVKDEVKLIDLETANYQKKDYKSNIGTKCFINIESNGNFFERDRYALVITLISLLIWEVPYYELNRNQEESWKTKLCVLYYYALKVKNINILEIDFIKSYFHNHNILDEQLNINNNIHSAYSDLFLIVTNSLERSLTSNMLNTWVFSEFSKNVNPLCIQHGPLGSFTLLGNYKLDQQRKYLDKVQNSIAGIDYSILKHLSDTSYLFGWAGISWILATLLGKSVVMNDLYNIAIEKIRSMPSENDFALGKSGHGYTIVYLLLNDYIKEDYLPILIDDFKEVNKEIDNYFKKGIDVNDLTSIGFAHGIVGKLFFSYFASLYLNDEENKNKVIAHIKKICNEFRSELEISQKQKKYSSWCNGLPGIVSALSQINYLENDLSINSFLQMASKNMIQNVPSLSNSLCHGIGSVLEAYNDLSFFQHMDVTFHKEIIEAVIFTRIFYDQDGLAKIYDETKNKFTLDFGTGASGTLYTVLRSRSKDTEKNLFLSKKEMGYLWKMYQKSFSHS